MATLLSNLDDEKAANVWNNGLQFNHVAADCPICSSTILWL